MTHRNHTRRTGNNGAVDISSAHTTMHTADTAKQNSSFLPSVYAPDIVLSKAKGDRVWDTAGAVYIDFCGGIAVQSLGHSHPSILRAIHIQSKKIMHCSNLFASEAYIALAKELATLACTEFSSRGDTSILQNPFSACFLCNSGTEANEAALKFARLAAYRKNKKKKNVFVSFHNSFHGRTLGALSVTGQEQYRHAFAPLLPNCIHVPYNDCDALGAAIDENTAAVIVELIQGEGGLSSIDNKMAHTLHALARKFHFLIIADEVQTGLYRCGSAFASTLYGLRPDIITLAKALGGGLPAAAVLYRKDIQDMLRVGDHGSTLGGNPLVAAVALATLSVLRSQKFQEKRNTSAQQLYAMLQDICVQHSGLSVLGAGHLRGIRLDKKLDSSTIPAILSRCREKGLLILRTGSDGLRIAPSLNCSHTTMRKAMQILGTVLSELL
ncbi:acetylornithine aminotransferase-like [Ylistrum balloti]|uniref:acetylornithine aminotransferase-like n=1 Tax=Ylistrum balloti TaxID=509963 RepID=UPI002905A4C2|nr:acetylornithine aminotransferase-like [Ylistrum balloti]